jgi:uncharacterized protein YbjQ (UPF0145 family)
VTTGFVHPAHRAMLMPAASDFTPPMETAMDEAMTSTTFTLDGYHIVQALGVVRGVTVRSRSLFGTIGARVETLLGGHISLLTTLCERARADAFDILLAQAQRRGANAVVGVRYDATEIMSGVTEVLCYGTAVVVEPAE